MQKTTGNGLFTSSQSNPFMSGNEMTNFITKLTIVFVAIFFINTLILAKLSYITSKEKQKNLFKETEVTQTTTQSVPLS
jgi:preprotein translocase subunit SecG